MKRFTQSNLDPGNCWQTAIACLLEVDPAELPPQHELEALDNALEGWGSYTNILNGYLEKHHGLMYIEMPVYHAVGLGITREAVLCGPTVRTADTQIHHVVIGIGTTQIWDVHPSRSGLLKVERVGYLIPRPDEVREHTVKMCSGHRDEGSEVSTKIFLDCLCPAHELEWARQRAAAMTPSAA